MSRTRKPSGITDQTPTTAEEAMDADDDVEDFVNESAYAPTDT